MKLGGTGVHRRLLQEPLGPRGIILVCCPALCLLLVSTRVLFPFACLLLAPTRGAIVSSTDVALAIAPLFAPLASR
jgi:hypothetical protein